MEGGDCGTGVRILYEGCLLLAGSFGGLRAGGLRSVRFGVRIAGLVRIRGELPLAGPIFLGHVEQAVPICLLMEVPHELAPPEELANEAFGAGKWDEAGVSGSFDVADELSGELPGEVDEGRCPGVEELKVIVAHGVFEGSEGGQEMLECEAPHTVGVGLGAGQVESIDGAEVMGVFVRNIRDDLGGDLVGRVDGRDRNRDLVLVGVSVFGVVGELTSERLSVPHQDACLLTHGAVEAVHDVVAGAGACFAAPVGAVDGGEVFELREPGNVRHFVEFEAIRDGLFEIEAEFTLCWTHQGE